MINNEKNHFENTLYKTHETHKIMKFQENGNQQPLIHEKNSLCG